MSRSTSPTNGRGSQPVPSPVSSPANILGDPTKLQEVMDQIAEQSRLELDTRLALMRVCVELSDLGLPLPKVQDACVGVVLKWEGEHSLFEFVAHGRAIDTRFAAEGKFTIKGWYNIECPPVSIIHTLLHMKEEGLLK